MFTKYIILKKNFVAIMFDEAVEHCKMAEEFGGKDAVRSAGFFTLTVDKCGAIIVRCFGGSTSLGGLKAAPRIDEPMIRHALHL